MKSAVERGVTVRKLLIDAGEELPGEVREELLARGPAAISHLLGVLLDPELDQDDAPGDGWASYHAAEMLGALGAVDAVPAMLRRLASVDPMESGLRDEIMSAIMKMAPAAHERILDGFADPELASVRDYLWDLLARSGVRDDRALALLVEQLEHDPEGAPSNFEAYGDAQALPHLQRALERERRQGSRLSGAAIELIHAIKALGGSPPPDFADAFARTRRAEEVLEVPMREEQVLRLFARAATPVEPAPPRRERPAVPAPVGQAIVSGGPKQPPRNGPCSCGSGKKFKRCHGR